MIFRNLDNDGDWEFGKGKQSYVKEDAAITLNIKTRVLSFFKNCFFDTESGIDWFSRLNYRDQFDLLKNDVRNTILQSQDVVSMEDFTAILTNRTFSAIYVIKTIFSPSVQGDLTQEL